MKILNCLPLALLLAAPLAALAQGHAHVHGLAKLDIAVEAKKITVSFETPLDNLVGFERAPRTDSERKRADEAVARLRDGDAMFRFDPAAGCKLAGVELSSAALKLGKAEAAPKDGHAELEGEWQFDCADATRAALCRGRPVRLQPAQAGAGAAGPAEGAAQARAEAAPYPHRARPMIELNALRYRWPGASHDCLDIDALRVAAGARCSCTAPAAAARARCSGCWPACCCRAPARSACSARNWATLSGARRDAFRADHVGYIFQQFNLLPYLSVLDNVLLPCRFSGLRRQRAAAAAGSPQAAAGALLQRVGLSEALWTRRAAMLSVGQQQRVAAARALIGQPELVIADEPTSALDSALRDSFMALLLQQCRDAGSTLVFVSHDERLAALFDHSLSLPQINRATQAAAA